MDSQINEVMKKILTRKMEKSVPINSYSISITVYMKLLKTRKTYLLKIFFLKLLYYNIKILNQYAMKF